jgi:hypothetical protein
MKIQVLKSILIIYSLVCHELTTIMMEDESMYYMIG